jgi:hypothetical protein
MSFASGVLGRDNIPVPGSLHLGFTSVTPEQNGSANIHPISNPFATTGMVVEDQHNRSFGTGVSVSNFTSVHHSFVLNWSKRFPMETIHRQMLAFVCRAVKSPILKLHTNFEVASLHALNEFLYSEAGRAIYGVEETSEKLMKDFGFAGAFLNEIPGWAGQGEASGKGGWDCNFVVGRRARCQAITRAHMKKGDNYHDRSLHSVYLLAIRRKQLDAAKDAKPYYWAFNLHVSDNDCEPSPWLYIDSQGMGNAKRIGFILQNNGDAKRRPDHITKARRSLKGSSNVVERKYLTDVPLLPYVDIAIHQ